MNPEQRFDQIEIKLAHLERALSELNDVVVRQQREIERLTAHNRQLIEELETLDSATRAGAGGFERPPHY